MDRLWDEIYIRLEQRGNKTPTQNDVLEMADELREDMYQQRRAGDAVEDRHFFERLVDLTSIISGMMRII